MPKMYKIVKRDDAHCCLWRLPDRKLLWATPLEFEQFAASQTIGVLGEQHGRLDFFRGRALVEAAQSLYTGDDLTKVLSDNPNGRAVAVDVPFTKWLFARNKW